MEGTIIVLKRLGKDPKKGHPNPVFHMGKLKLHLGKGKKDTLFITSIMWKHQHSFTEKKQIKTPYNYITIKELAEVYGKRFRNTSLKRLYDYFSSKNIWVHIKEHRFDKFTQT